MSGGSCNRPPVAWIESSRGLVQSMASGLFAATGVESNSLKTSAAPQRR